MTSDRSDRFPESRSFSYREKATDLTRSARNLMCAAEAVPDRRTLLRLAVVAPLFRWTITEEHRAKQHARGNSDLALKREQTMRLLGAYTNYNRTSWNIDSGQPDENAWKAGRDDFCDKMGISHSTLNAGQNFGGGG